MHVGIVGCGTAGPAAAIPLARAGHRVTILDRFDSPRPVGAGLLIQPIGQAVMAQLGLLDELTRHAAPVQRLLGKNTRGRAILDVRYADFGPTQFGLGVQRGVLFSLLLRAAQEAGAELLCGQEAGSIETTRQGLPCVRTPTGVLHGPFDLLVVADGSRSSLRPVRRATKREAIYPWAAMWFVARAAPGQFTDTLEQVYRDTRQMVGFLPTGRAPGDAIGHRSVSVFWSLPRTEIQSIRAQPLERWKRSVLDLAPRAEPLLEQVTDWNEVTPATYWDVVMRPWHRGRMVWIGDAAHAMSPQLGMGANLALVDAQVLAAVLADGTRPVGESLCRYSAARRNQIRYYQFCSRWLTPFFQSGLSGLGPLRDLLMPLSASLRPIRHLMLSTLCGAIGNQPLRPIGFPRDPAHLTG